MVFLGFFHFSIFKHVPLKASVFGDICQCCGCFFVLRFMCVNRRICLQVKNVCIYKYFISWRWCSWCKNISLRFNDIVDIITVQFCLLKEINCIICCYIRYWRKTYKTLRELMHHTSKESFCLYTCFFWFVYEFR